MEMQVVYKVRPIFREEEQANDKKPDFTDEQKALIAQMVEDAKKEATESAKAALAELENLQKKSRLSEKDKKDLDERIKTLQGQIRTKEEQANSEREELVKKHKNELEELQTERDKWHGLFTRSTIKTSITQACLSPEHTAFNPMTVEAILGPMTTLEPALDDQGKPTGDYVPTVKMQSADSTGKVSTLVLTVPDAVKHLSAQEGFMHLFKGKGAGGIDGRNDPTGRAKDWKELSNDPVQYRKARSEGKQPG